MDLEAVLKLVDATVSGKRSEALLLDADKAHGSRDYNKGKEYIKEAKRSTCTNCGGATYVGENYLENRKKHCKAFGTKCNNCGKLDHFANGSNKPVP